MSLWTSGGFLEACLGLLDSIGAGLKVHLMFCLCWGGAIVCALVGGGGGGDGGRGDDVDGPRNGQDDPTVAQHGFKMAPRRPQDGPGWAQNGILEGSWQAWWVRSPLDLQNGPFRLVLGPV